MGNFIGCVTTDSATISPFCHRRWSHLDWERAERLLPRAVSFPCPPCAGVDRITTVLPDAGIPKPCLPKSSRSS